MWPYVIFCFCAFYGRREKYMEVVGSCLEKSFKLLMVCMMCLWALYYFLLSVSAHLYHSFNVTFTFSFEILYIHDALILTSRVVNGLWTLACQICPLSLYHQNKLVIFFIFEGTKCYMLEIIFRIFIHLLKWARLELPNMCLSYLFS